MCISNGSFCRDRRPRLSVQANTINLRRRRFSLLCMDDQWSSVVGAQPMISCRDSLENPCFNIKWICYHPNVRTTDGRPYRHFEAACVNQILKLTACLFRRLDLLQPLSALETEITPDAFDDLVDLEERVNPERRQIEHKSCQCSERNRSNPEEQNVTCH